MAIQCDIMSAYYSSKEKLQEQQLSGFPKKSTKKRRKPEIIFVIIKNQRGMI